MLQKFINNMEARYHTFMSNSHYRRLDQASRLQELYQLCLDLTVLCLGLLTINFKLNQSTSRQEVLESYAALKSLEEKKPNQLS